MINNTRVVLAAASLSSVAPRFPNTSSTTSCNNNNNNSNNANNTSVSVSVGNNKSNSTSATISLSSGESIPSSAKTRLARTTSTSRQQPPTSPQVATPEPQYPEPPALRTMSAYFPLGYKEAAYQWWTSVTPPIAQQNLLSYIPYIKASLGAAAATAIHKPDSITQSDPYGRRTWRTSLVQLSGKDRAINEFTIEREGEEVDNTLVVLHGYGAGLGFFYKNFEPLSRDPGWRLHSLDLLGMGNSSRPPFKVHAKEQKAKIREAEDWFVDALEEWRRIRKIEKFTLLGHSLGGYLAISYAIKYPGHLNKLILASPVGIPEDPYAVNAEMPEPSSSTIANEFTQDQKEDIVKATEPVKDKNNFLNARTKAEARSANDKEPPKRPINKWFVWLWDANVSPFSLVRLSGPFGPRLVSGWTSRRFSHLPLAESQALHDYSYSLFRQRGSGEYALAYLLAPGAFARSPMINRIHEVGRQVFKKEDGSQTRETGIPVVFMYGEQDWMDINGGYAAEEKLKARSRQALLHGTEEEKRKENGRARVVSIPKAGHHLYIDNADEFNRVVMEELRATADQVRKEKSA
ncbi:hypothetical protein MCOR25_000868 [Pyricularia grisea]|uniref:AB hydrolase-1 domain-containing protein n=1 Tax=Pyricularia grisea TaxID=148305 RepID=A0A6P8BM33_PYRGI|nr:uncharacterized protein PgNI_01710 [Pyricularia grisea]KAI6381987.1 hypothetical protein MCOR25_000868 [Pyricularia grisea]TLD17695.1 hypothetical protein PgNI_01710 [Pyricularia grisea]